METKERIRFFGEIAGSCRELYLWRLSPEMELLETNCPQRDLVMRLFDETKEAVLPDTTPEETVFPCVMTSRVGAVWVADVLSEPAEESGFYVLGPFFLDDQMLASLKYSLEDRYRIHGAYKREVLEFAKNLPVLTVSYVYELAVSLHLALTGTKIAISEIGFPRSKEIYIESEETGELHGTYEAEREMLRLVREGDLSLFSYTEKMAMTGRVGKMSNDPERQYKSAIIVMAVLFSRAAIEGGLNPEIALSLTDRYMQQVEAARTVADLKMIAQTIQEDFVMRVHEIRHSNGKYSKSTQAVIDYVSAQLMEEIHLSSLARMLGYSEYYLTKKFKRETGTSFKEYVRAKRLEKAKELLQNQLSVQEVAARLRFSSQSYFTQEFKKEYGVTPSEYRQDQSTVHSSDQ